MNLVMDSSEDWEWVEEIPGFGDWITLMIEENKEMLKYCRKGEPVDQRGR